MAKPKRPKKIGKSGVAYLLPCFLALILIIQIGLMLKNSNREETSSIKVEVAEEETVAIFVPTRQIARGEKISTVPLSQITWPRSRLSSDFILDPREYKDAIANSSLPKLLPITQASLSKKDFEGNQVLDSIPQGMRAITVKVDVESAVEGWAQSGNFVDVILVRMGQTKDSGLESKIIAENIRILSAGRTTVATTSDNTSPNPPSTVTLLTTQEDALRIKTASSIGKLTFALRGTGDQAPSITDIVDQRALLGSAKSIIPSKKDYRGIAKGPDGKTYILGEGIQWIETTSAPKSLSISTSNQEER